MEDEDFISTIIGENPIYQAGEYLGLWGEDDDAADVAGGGGVPSDEGDIIDLFSDILGGTGGGGASYGAGPSNQQLAAIEASGQDITPYLPQTAIASATQLVQAVMSDGPIGMAARALLKRTTGFIFGRAPTYQGGPLRVAMLEMLMDDLSSSEIRALAWRVAGESDAPAPNATKAERNAFTLLYCYDGMRALNADNLATLIMESTGNGKRRR